MTIIYISLASSLHLFHLHTETLAWFHYVGMGVLPSQISVLFGHVKLPKQRTIGLGVETLECKVPQKHLLTEEKVDCLLAFIAPSTLH